MKDENYIPVLFTYVYNQTTVVINQNERTSKSNRQMKVDGGEMEHCTHVFRWLCHEVLCANFYVTSNFLLHNNDKFLHFLPCVIEKLKNLSPEFPMAF